MVNPVSRPIDPGSLPTDPTINTNKEIPLKFNSGTQQKTSTNLPSPMSLSSESTAVKDKMDPLKNSGGGEMTPAPGLSEVFEENIKTQQEITNTNSEGTMNESIK